MSGKLPHFEGGVSVSEDVQLPVICAPGITLGRFPYIYVSCFPGFFGILWNARRLLHLLPNKLYFSGIVNVFLIHIHAL